MTDDDLSSCTQVIPSDGLDLRKLVARYLYQILVGCQDNSCRCTFCKSNLNGHILGRTISQSAALPLAFQLSNLHERNQLCKELKVEVLPLSIRNLINETNPTKSLILTMNLSSVHCPNQKSINGFAVNVLKSTVCSEWETYGDSPNVDVESLCYSYIKKKTAIFKASKLVPFGNSSLLNLLNPVLIVHIAQNTSEPVTTHIISEIKRMVSEEARGGFQFSRYFSHTLDVIQNALEVYSQSQMPIGASQILSRKLTHFISFSGLKPKLPASLFSSDIFDGLVIDEDYITTTMFFLTFHQYISRWPFYSYYTNRLSYLPDIIRVLDEADIYGTYIPSFKHPRMITSTNGYFRKVPLIKDAVYMSKLHGFLTERCRYQLFRYGFLRQMNTVVHRFSNQKLLLSNFTYLTKCFLSSSSRIEGSIRILTVSLKSFINCEFLVFEIDRNNVLSSAIDIVSRALMIEDLLRRPLRVKFGVDEIGVDQGGVQIEFFRILGHQMCYSGHEFFTVDKSSQLAYFNPAYNENPNIYEYLGILLGLSIYNGCTIGIWFPSFVYSAIKAKSFDDFAKKHYTLRDYSELSPIAAKSLSSLSSIENLASVGLSFEYTYETFTTGCVKTVSLPSAFKFNQVDNSNVNQFVDEYITYALHTAVEPCFKAFVKGVRFMLSQDILDLVSTQELKIFTEGTNNIEVSELQRHTTYLDGFTPISPTIQYFWQILHEFSQTQLENFLEFVTGSRRVPIGGIQEFEFTIQHNGVDNTKLPTASVCFFRLFLPVYKSKKELKDRLLIAIENSTGFGLV